MDLFNHVHFLPQKFVCVSFIISTSCSSGDSGGSNRRKAHIYVNGQSALIHFSEQNSSCVNVTIKRKEKPLLKDFTK